MDITQGSEQKKNSFWLAKLHTQQTSGTVYQNQDVSHAPESIGPQDAVQSISKQKTIDKRTLETLITKSNRILVSISSHRFPFDFSPTTINIEEARVTIINRGYFYSSQVHSIDIKDITNIFINTSYYFAQLVIISRTFSENNIEVNFLWKNEAIRMRRIIEGLRMFKDNKVDTSKYTQSELLRSLEKFSTTEIVM